MASHGPLNDVGGLYKFETETDELSRQKWAFPNQSFHMTLICDWWLENAPMVSVTPHSRGKTTKTHLFRPDEIDALLKQSKKRTYGVICERRNLCLAQ